MVELSGSLTSLDRTTVAPTAKLSVMVERAASLALMAAVPNTGARPPHLLTVTLTVAAAAETKAFDTTTWTSYSPSTSARKLGVAECASLSAPALPTGMAVNCQAKLRSRCCVSVDELASSRTSCPICTPVIVSEASLTTGALTDVGQP